MLERIRQARETESGFTLIELLIVIIVLGILAAIVLFGVGTFSSDSKTSACKADARNIEIAATAYYAKQDPNAWPATVDVLVTNGYLETTPSTTGWSYNNATGKVSTAGC